MALTDPHEKSFDRDAALGQSTRVSMISVSSNDKKGFRIGSDVKGSVSHLVSSSHSDRDMSYR